MRLAVIIPLANEEQTVPKLLARVTAQLGPDDAVFCIVDNASKDDTRGAVLRFAENDRCQVSGVGCQEAGSGERGVGSKSCNLERSDPERNAWSPSAPLKMTNPSGFVNLEPSDPEGTHSGSECRPRKIPCDPEGGARSGERGDQRSEGGEREEERKSLIVNRTSNVQHPTSNIQSKPSHLHTFTPSHSQTHHDSRPVEAGPKVVCVYAPENRCVVDAYFRGYRDAYAAGAEWILEMDGGLSHLPEEIPRFIQAMETGVDFAGGSRFVEGSNYHESRFARWLTSRGGTWASNFLLRTKMKDMTSGFECFNRKAMQKVLDHGVRSKAHFFQTEIRYLMHRLTWVEVPITYSCPSKSIGKNSLLDALKCLWHLWRDKRNRR